MIIHLHTGNRLELLEDLLADIVSQPLDDPLEKEVIVVQSRGMERRLAIQLANRLGSWANCRYPFPNNFAWNLFRAAFPALSEENPFSPDIITWRLMEIIPGCLIEPGFETLSRYLCNDPSGLKLFQLSSQIADLFDQYTLFRPEMLVAWESGVSCGRCDQQAKLWRRLMKDRPGRHRGVLLREFQSFIKQGKEFPGKLPKRISVFGIPALPPFHTEILAALAARVEVHLFLLNPCQEHWFKIVSNREKSHRLSRLPLLSEAEAYLETGNPLLASFGRQGRDYLDHLFDSCLLDEDIGEFFVEPGRARMLNRIQSDILNLTDGTSADSSKLQIDPCDSSLQIHSCHTPLREIESLYDNLLGLFEEYPDLNPGDVLVMAPNIDEYAPYISSVFGGVRDEARRIPYSVADRSVSSLRRLIGGFIALLDLAESRVEASQLLDLLEQPAVSARFGLSAIDPARIRQWVDESGIRWGVDAEDRRKEGLPLFNDNSWRAGMDRLLLGYALPGDGTTLFEGILPCPGPEGSELKGLGGLLEFVESVFALRRELGVERTPSEWGTYMSGLIERFFYVDDELQGEQALLLSVFAELGKAQEAGFNGKLSPAVVRSRLKQQLSGETVAHGFLTGGVTFCAMLPMRSIPFKVIALVGMNDNVFPRQDRPTAFDLMAAFPRRGDRSLRDEDRYLFLEALLSARDCLYISYVGQSARDNTILPPSVLVSELIDYSERSFLISNSVEDQRKLVRERIVTLHHMHPFHRDYFSGSTPLFSYSTENCMAALAAGEGRANPGFLADIPLAPPENISRITTLTELIYFIGNPSEHFLRNRLGIRMERLNAALEDNEPFEVDRLEDYFMTIELIDHILAGRDPSLLEPVFRGRGVLPPAGPGEVAFDNLSGKASVFAEKVAPFLAGGSREAVETALSIDGFELTGRIDGIYPIGQVHYRPAKRKAKDILSTWVKHLALNAAAPSGFPTQSILIANDGCWRFEPVEEPEKHLSLLLALFRQGLCEPLRFFPETSLAYASRPEIRPQALVDLWTGSDWKRGELDDPSTALCFKDADPYELIASQQFRDIAEVIYKPLLASLKEEGA